MSGTEKTNGVVPEQAVPAVEAAADAGAADAGTVKGGTGRGRRKVFTGVVVSDKMDKTVRVQMTRKFLHRVYKKFVVRQKSFLAHD